MSSSTLVLLLALASASEAALGAACSYYGSPGVCSSTSTCAGAAAPSLAGSVTGCESDPADIQCCASVTCTANGVDGVCRSSTTCAAEGKTATTTANGATGCAKFPGPVQCCTATAAAIITTPTTPTTTKPIFYPLIVGDVEANKAAFSMRTTAASVRLDVRPVTPNPSVAPVSVTLPSAVAAIASAMEAELGMLPIAPALASATLETRARRVPLFARTHTLVFVPAANPAAAPLAQAKLQLLAEKCFVMALAGAPGAYRAIAFEDPCPSLPTDDDKAQVRFFSTKPGVTVAGLKAAAAADRLGAATAFAAKLTTFTASDGSKIDATLEKGHAYVVAVAHNGLRVVDFGDLRGDVNDNRKRIARLYVVDGLARVSEPVMLASSIADQQQQLKEAQALPSFNDRTMMYWLDNLTANTEYVASVTGVNGEPGPTARFRTPGDKARTVTFGVTSCLGPDNRPWPSLSWAAKHKLDFVVLNGDQVYADGSRLAAEFRAVWSDALQVQGYKDLFAATSIVAIWDDHELDDDWNLDITPSAIQRTAKRAYKEAVPAFYGQATTAAGALAAYNDDAATFYRKLSYGAVELFVLDTRSERQPSKNQYISPAQLNWIKAAVQASSAPFKMIVNTIPITDMNDLLLGIEEDNQWTYKTYVAQRNELLASLKSVAGVVFLSGDFHFGGLFHVGKTKSDPTYGIFEVLSGPGGSQINPYVSLRIGFFVRLFDIFDRQFTKLITTWTYTKFTANPATKKLLIQFIGDTGKEVWATELDLSTPTAKITTNGWSLFRNDLDDDGGASPESTDPTAAAAPLVVALLVAAFPLVFSL